MPRRAFTLIELLVVVAVIGVLISVLLPALGVARRAAETAGCLNNLRQLAAAQLLYANDHDGRLVSFGLAHGGGTLDPELSWVVDLDPYSDHPLATRSPVDDSPHWPESRGGAGVEVDDRLRMTSYGLNVAVTPKPPIDPTVDDQVIYDRLGVLRRPTRTVQWLVMAFEGAYAVSDHVHASGWYLRFAPDRTPANAAGQSEIGAHGGPAAAWDSESGYAYLDGHAATEAFRDVYEGPDRNRFDPRRAN